mgnify:CR=1 FL=1
MHKFWEELAYGMFRQNDWEYRLGDKYIYEKNLIIITTEDKVKGSLFKLITEKRML